MSELIEISRDEWLEKEADGSANYFFKKYLHMLDTQGYLTEPALRYYAASLIFHNQNGFDLQGGKQIFEFIPKLFESFTKLHHEVLGCRQISRPDGSAVLEVQMIRHIWVKGQPFNEQEATISAPLHATVMLEPSESAEADMGCQIKEMWIYWDTMLMAPYIKTNNVFFKTSRWVD